MSEQGFSEDTLTPAFLLLSGCETDLARRADAEQTSDAEEHRNRAQAWLQKVYGTFDAETSTKGRVSAIPSNPSIGSGPHPTMLPTSKNESGPHVVRLQGEIQSLLEERKELSLLLAHTRAAKRKLEDDLAYESSGRRRLLQDYDDLQEDLAMARKMENFALSQVKREVESRRKAEENARTENAMRLEIQSLWQRGSAPPFADIANTIKTEDRAAPTKSNAS
ncbi:hypothetical protein DXG03_003155 [Asterophora parasitica]|uniref:Uncharacterized protein n=1 Tax=Asterophora parasitica TaxID=117018 RepID=A0A9P7GF93_9AGAR|nr:hypothetical protein DXG03_003155 [Asterophora parasitica]